MKQKTFVITGLASVLALGAWMVAAAPTQQKAQADSPDRLGQAAALLGQGRAQEARTLLATIDKADSKYAESRCYDALGLYALNDKRRYLRALSTPEVRAANISPAMREDMDYKEIDSLFACRHLDDVLSKTDGFQSGHAQSARRAAVAEYHLAALFERGMKKTVEACMSGRDTPQFQSRWAEGRSNLVQFLDQAVAFNGTNYHSLPGHSDLTEQVWKARVALGGEEQLLQNADAGDAEKIGLLRLRLYQKFTPADIDQNLQRMTNFIAAFPDSKSRKRVEFDMAGISFNRAEACLKESESARLAGDAATAAAKRAQADAYFNYTRSLQDRLEVDHAAGIEEADVFDRQDDLMNSYHLEKDHARVLNLATRLLHDSKPGSLRWMMAKNYRGISLQSQTPPDGKKAAAEFDSVLASGFTGRADNDHQLLVAARWRIQIARQEKDGDKAAQVIQTVEASKCVKNQKTAFLKDYTSPPTVTGQ